MIILFNVVAIVGCCLSLVANTYVLCLGRFIYGFAAGVIICATPLMLEETIPAHAMDFGYGISTNLSLTTNVTVMLLLGFGMPNSTEELATTNFWRVIYSVPIFISLIVIPLNIFVLTEDSLGFHVS